MARDIAIATETIELRDVTLVAGGLAFPEGPVAMLDGSVVFVEMHGGRISRAAPGGAVTEVCRTGGGPNGAAVGPDGALYVCNNGGRLPGQMCAPSIQRVDLDSGACEFVHTFCDGAPLVSPNDLVFDRTGNLWFTDFGGGAVYYANPDGSRIERVVDGLDHPNGIGLSPEESTLYWAQTFTRQVLRRRIVAPGRIEPSTGYGVRAALYGGGLDPFALLAGFGGAQELDSLAVDSSGRVCVGTLVESGVTVIPADGSTIRRHTLPAEFADLAVTNICFGGPEHRTAFITLSQTGRIVQFPWPVPGLRLAFER